jgi:hypothetical protein
VGAEKNGLKGATAQGMSVFELKAVLPSPLAHVRSPDGLALLSTMIRYGAHETEPWLVPTVVALTVSYGILMMLLWPHEKVSQQQT